MALYEFKGTKSPSTNYVSSVPTGNGDEVLRLGDAAELSKEKAEELSDQYGIVLETTTKQEVERKQKQDPAAVTQAADTAGAGPIFATSEPDQPNQAENDTTDTDNDK